MIEITVENGVAEIVLDAPAAIHLAYRPGMPLTHAVWRRGKQII